MAPRFAILVGISGMMLSLSAMVRAAETRHTNVLIILCDDVGWGEFGFQGAKEIPTPHIDSIAQHGIRFTQGYVAATYCSPSRAGLLTGRYPTRFGYEFNSVAREHGLPVEEATIANRFQSAGYATCAIGKWHLGSRPPYRPLARGFDEFYGTLTNTPYFHPIQFIDSRVSPEVQEVTDKAFYTTDAYAERAVRWLDEHADTPWLLYLPFNAQHAPLQVPPRYLDRVPPMANKKRRNFLAMMTALDDAVGRVLDKIRALGQEEQTLIWFLSDNGGPTRGTTSRNGPLRGNKATTWEGGIRVPFCVQWKGKLPAGKTFDAPVIQLDILPTSLAAADVPADPAWQLDGVNLLPFLQGQPSGVPHEMLAWRFGRQWAIRQGDWKLVAGAGATQKPALYNLRQDPGEGHDQQEAEPQKVAELQALWNAWNAQQAEPIVPDQPHRRRRNRAA